MDRWLKSTQQLCGLKQTLLFICWQFCNLERERWITYELKSKETRSSKMAPITWLVVEIHGYLKCHQGQSEHLVFLCVFGSHSRTYRFWDLTSRYLYSGLHLEDTLEPWIFYHVTARQITKLYLYPLLFIFSRSLRPILGTQVCQTILFGSRRFHRSSQLSLEDVV